DERIGFGWKILLRIRFSPPPCVVRIRETITERPMSMSGYKGCVAKTGESREISIERVIAQFLVRDRIEGIRHAGMPRNAHNLGNRRKSASRFVADNAHQRNELNDADGVSEHDRDIVPELVKPQPVGRRVYHLNIGPCAFLRQRLVEPREVM